MRKPGLGILKRLPQEALLTAGLLVAGVFILMPSTVPVEQAENPSAPQPLVVFRGIPMQEHAAEAPGAAAAPAPPAAPAAPRQQELIPIAQSEPGGSSRGGPVIELVYEDRSALVRQASEYGFRVLPPGQSAPSGSVGSIDCPGFSLHFDRALYRRINREIGPLAGLPRGTRLSVTLVGGRLRRL